MKYRLHDVLLAFVVISIPVMAGTPVFQATSPLSQTVRMQDFLFLSVSATDPSGHYVVCDWTIATDPTAKVYFINGGVPVSTVSGNGARVAFPWIGPEASPAAPNPANTPFIGQSVLINVTARHGFPADGPETASVQFTIQIIGVNHPPVPRITGTLGTPAARIPSRAVVSCSSETSTDPDPGNAYRASWTLGSRVGGTYLGGPVVFGSDSSAMSFTVPDMTAAIDQQIILYLDDGMHIVQTTAVAYLQPEANNLPTARILYKTGDSAYRPAPTAPVTVACPESGSVDILLDGLTSQDDGGASNLSFKWTLFNGITRGSVTLSGDETHGSIALRVASATSGTVTVTLKVTDQQGHYDTAEISLVITDPAAKPTVQIAVEVDGMPLTSPIEEGASVTLEGLGSAAFDGRKVGLTYEWRQLSGPSVVLTAPKAVLTNFVAPAVSADGKVLRFELEVTDTRVGASAKKEADITVNMPTVYFAQVGVGRLGQNELRTLLILINGRSQAAKQTSVEFFNSAGQPFVPLVNGEPWGNEPFEIPPESSTRLVFSPANGQIEIGWVRVKSGLRLIGLALFQIWDPVSGEITQEASVLSSQRSKRLVSYFNPNEETAVAVANPADVAAAVRVKVLDYPDGNQWVVKDVSLLPEADQGHLAPQNHCARFLDVGFFGPFPSGFEQGSLVLESDTEVLVTLLKTRGGLVLSSPPVAAENQRAPVESYIAQVGVGPVGADRLRTVLLLVNGRSEAANGVEVECFNDQGGPLQVTVDGQQWQGAAFDIPPLSCKRLELSSDQVQVGWARIRSGRPVAGLALYQIVGQQGELKREASVFSSRMGRKFATHLEPGEETALAVANPGDRAAQVKFRLLDYVDGHQRLIKEAALFPELPDCLLGVSKQRAKFIDSSLLGELPPDFREGTLVLESDNSIVVTVLKTQNGRVLSALPLAPAP